MTEPTGFPVRLLAIVHKVQTIADGGGRISLDFGESELSKAFELFKRAGEPGLLLVVTFEEQAVDPRFYETGAVP